jgi:hypothetical protein
MTPAQRDSGLDAIRELVLACEPRAVGDARVMLATASKYFGDVAGDVVDIDTQLTEFEVSRWSHAQLQAGMAKDTLLNHVGRLHRFLRVRRGLPARMAVPRPQAEDSRALDDSQRMRWEHQLTGTQDCQLIAAYVVAVGAGRNGQRLSGTRIERRDGQVVAVASDRVKPIVDAVLPLAGMVVGVRVGAGAWAALRAHAADTGFVFDWDVSRATRALLAMREDRTGLELISRYRLTRRELDVTRPLLDPVDAPAVVAALRHGIRPG